MASTTSACWPIALHIRILASGSCFTISRTASIPPMSGITMSIVTRSGLSCRYFSTAWVPVSASPTTSNPACARMSVIIVRMKMASSQTRTVWLTARSLSRQNRSQQRCHVQHDEQITLTATDRPHQPRIDSGQRRAILQRRIPHRHHVHYLIHREAHETIGRLEDDGRTRCGVCEGGRRGYGRFLPQRTPPFHDSHQRAADIHEPRDDRRRARNTRRWEARENLPHLVDLGRANQVSHTENQQSGEATVSHRMRRSQNSAAV